jgi:hypothetical protein
MFTSRVFIPGVADGMRPQHGAGVPWTRVGAKLGRRRRYGQDEHQAAIQAICDLGLLEMTTGSDGPESIVCVVTHPLVTEVNAACLSDRRSLARTVHTTVVALLSQATRGRDPFNSAEYARWPLLAPHLIHALTHTVRLLPRSSIVTLIDAANTTSWGLVKAGDYLASHALAVLASETARHLLP